MVCIIWAPGSDQIVSNSCRNGGAAVTCQLMVCALKNFKVWRFRSHFAAAKWVYGAFKWHLWNGALAVKSGSFYALGFRSRFAIAKWGSLCCEMALVCQKWFRSCETPFQMASRLRNSRSALHARLQTAITSSFHLQITYHLKRWTPNFPSFETRYGMYNLSSRKCFKNVSNSSKMEVRHFRSWFARSSSNGHNFSVSNPNQARFEAMDSWLPKLWNEIWYA